MKQTFEGLHALYSKICYTLALHYNTSLNNIKQNHNKISEQEIWYSLFQSKKLGKRTFERKYYFRLF